MEEVGDQRHASAALTPRRGPVPTVQEAGWTPWRSGRMRKISSPPGIDPRTVQLIASPYITPTRPQCIQETQNQTYI